MKYIIPKAYNTVTHETVLERRLDNGRYGVNQKPQVEELARLLAAKMTRRTGHKWRGFVDTYNA